MCWRWTAFMVVLLAALAGCRGGGRLLGHRGCQQSCDCQQHCGSKKCCGKKGSGTTSHNNSCVQCAVTSDQPLTADSDASIVGDVPGLPPFVPPNQPAGRGPPLPNARWVINRN